MDEEFVMTAIDEMPSLVGMLFPKKSLSPSSTITGMIDLVRGDVGKIRSLDDLLFLLRASRRDIIGHGSTATTIGLSSDLAVRYLDYPDDFDPWFDGYGKYCLRNNAMTLLPRVYGIIRTKSLGVAFLERLTDVGTLLQKLNKILPASLADDNDIDHLFDNMAMYFSGDRNKYATSKENLVELTDMNDSKELATLFVEIESGLGFSVHELVSLYYKIAPSLNIEDGEVNIYNKNVGWRRSTGELVIFDPVA